MIESVIIDDEIQILYGLKKLIDWETLGYTIPRTFLDPYNALSYIKEHNIMVVIIDIEMPEITGLDLIEKILEFNRQTKFVVISGYDYFNYIHKALILGVKNYILKPIDETDLSNTLLSIRADLKTTESSIFEYPTLKNQMFSKLVNGNVYNLSPTEKQMYNYYKNKFAYQLVFAYFSNSDDKEIYLKSESNALELLTVFGNFKEYYIVPAESGILFVLIKDNTEEPAVHESTNLKNNRIEEIIFLIYTPILYDYEEFFICAKSMSHQAYRKYFYSSNSQSTSIKYFKYLGKKKPAGLESELGKLQISVAEKLKQYICQLNNEAIEIEYSNLANHIRQFFHICSPSKIVHMYNEILSQLITYLVNKLNLHNKILLFQSITNQLDECLDSLDLLTSSSIRILNKALEAAMDLTTTIKERPIALIEFYIKLNYEQPLTLNSVANRFYYNPSYLSYLFSKNGKSFLSCLNDTRLEQSVKLLINTSYKISLIAFKVGFSNSKTFYRAFQKKYKCTPTQLRKNTNKKDRK
jgi:two-component system response regulator YesN